MKLLREYIRELLTEAAKGPADLPEGVFVQVIDRGDSGIRFRYAFKQPWSDNPFASESPAGKVAIMKPDHPCGGAYEVVLADAQSGWGPMLYDVAMEWATQNGGGLVSDRSSVSPAARGVWNYYLSNRGDVQSVQLDDLRNTITPEEEDNCEQHSSTVGFTAHPSGTRMPKTINFQESPLSKRYTKPPTTMNALKTAGKLVIS